MENGSIAIGINKRKLDVKKREVVEFIEKDLYGVIGNACNPLPLFKSILNSYFIYLILFTIEIKPYL